MFKAREQKRLKSHASGDVGTSKKVARKVAIPETCEMDGCTKEAVGQSKPNNDKMVCQRCHNAAARRQKQKAAKQTLNPKAAKQNLNPKAPANPKPFPKTVKKFFRMSKVGKGYLDFRLQPRNPAGPFVDNADKERTIERWWKELSEKELEAVKREFQTKKKAYKERKERYEAYMAARYKKRFPNLQYRQNSNKQC